MEYDLFIDTDMPLPLPAQAVSRLIQEGGR